MKFSVIKYWTIVFILVIIIIGIYLVFSKILESYIVGQIVESEALNNF
jgi:multisubunit Na+/H+ antiporter MnhC subunit